MASIKGERWTKTGSVPTGRIATGGNVEEKDSGHGCKVETLFLGKKSSENLGCFIQVFEKKLSLDNITSRLIQDGVPVVSKCASHIINLLTASEVAPNKA